MTITLGYFLNDNPGQPRYIAATSAHGGSKTCYSSSTLLGGSLGLRLMSSHRPCPCRRRSAVARLLIVIAVGVVFAVGASVLVGNALGGVANGTPSKAPISK